MGSYPDRIDLFDPGYFRINKAEAERMDPEHRLMMECAAEAVLNAGYKIDQLKGKRVGLFHTPVESRYRSQWLLKTTRTKDRRNNQEPNF